MASVYWPYAIYFIKVGQSQLAQKLTTPSSNFYITYYFKYDPNKQIFSHSVLTLHTTQNCNQHLLPIDKIHPWAIEPPGHCYPSELYDPETPHHSAKGHHLDM